MNSMKRQLVICSPFFYPELISTGKYNTTLARGLIEAGYEVSVICSHPLYPSWRPKISHETLPGVNIYRAGGFLRYPKNAWLRRALLEIWFCLHSLLQFTHLRRTSQTIIAIFPPSLFMIILPLLLPRGTKVIGVVHDLQGVYASIGGGIVKRVLRGAIAFCEKKGFSNCDHLIFLSETMRRLCEKEYQLPSSSSSVFYPFANIGPIDGSGEFLNHLFDSNKKSVVYSGALGEKQHPENLVDLLLAIANKYSHVQVFVFSAGPHFETLKKKFKNTPIVFHELVNEVHLPELLRRSDVQIIPQSPKTSDGSLPSKLPNLIAANVKVFCITDKGSELGDIVSAYSNGAVSNCWDIDECTDEIIGLLNRETSYLQSNATLLSKFTLGSLINQIASVG